MYIGHRCTHGNMFSRVILITRSSCIIFFLHTLFSLYCFFIKAVLRFTQLCTKLFLTGVKDGGNSSEDTPVPIPNTEVKLTNVDDTALATVWESR